MLILGETPFCFTSKKHSKILVRVNVTELSRMLGSQRFSGDWGGRRGKLIMLIILFMEQPEQTLCFVTRCIIMQKVTITVQDGHERMHTVSSNTQTGGVSTILGWY